MKNEITDKDVLAFIDAAWENMEAEILSVYRSAYATKAHFAVYPKGDYRCETRIESDTIEGLIEQLKDHTPEKVKREKLAKLRSEAAELARELGEEA
jgi:hypothetical protein